MKNRTLVSDIKAFFIAPLIVVLVPPILIYFCTDKHEYGLDYITGVVLGASVFLTIAYTLMFAIGLPIHSLLKKRKITSLLAYSISGVISGLAAYLGFYTIFYPVSFVDLWLVLFAVVMGLSVSVLFWFLAVRAQNA